MGMIPHVFGMEVGRHAKRVYYFAPDRNDPLVPDRKRCLGWEYMNRRRAIPGMYYHFTLPGTQQRVFVLWINQSYEVRESSLLAFANARMRHVQD